jgi:hypothetical protein
MSLLLLLALAGPSAQAAAPAEALAANGLVLSADLREEYLAGFPLLVDLTVSNRGATPLAFPDLGARPHLVHFTVGGPKGRSERHTTAPAVEPASTWNVPPGASRHVLLEVPSSAAFPAGSYSLVVSVADPAGAVTLPSAALKIVPANPVAGTPLWEPTIAANAGAMFPWVHQASSGFDLYLMHFDPAAPARVIGQYALAHLLARVDPVLARGRSNEARARHVYWLGNGNQLTVARLDVTRFEAPPRTFSLPYPKVELLDRGVSDGRGGLVVPVWIPNPTGTAGTIRAWSINARGQQQLRDVGAYPRRPTLTATAADAGANLVLAVALDTGVDLYRIDTTAPAEVPAHGTRVWRADGTWTPRALTFDVLPDAAEKPGGLSLLTVLTRGAPGAMTHRMAWTNLDGVAISDSGERPWPFAGDVLDILPGGYGTAYVLARDASGWSWGADSGPAAVPEKGAAGALWSNGSSLLLRALGGPTVVTDRVLGPRTP